MDPSLKLTAIGVVGHGNNPHGLLRYVSTQDLHVPSCVLVSSKHCPPHPVGPEDVVSVHGQAKWMHRLTLQHQLHEGSTTTLKKPLNVLHKIDSC